MKRKLPPKKRKVGRPYSPWGRIALAERYAELKFEALKADIPKPGYEAELALIEESPWYVARIDKNKTGRGGSRVLMKSRPKTPEEFLTRADAQHRCDEYKAKETDPRYDYVPYKPSYDTLKKLRVRGRCEAILQDEDLAERHKELRRRRS